MVVMTTIFPSQIHPVQKQGVITQLPTSSAKWCLHLKTWTQKATSTLSRIVVVTYRMSVRSAARKVNILRRFSSSGLTLIVSGCCARMKTSTIRNDVIAESKLLDWIPYRIATTYLCGKLAWNRTRMMVYHRPSSTRIVELQNVRKWTALLRCLASGTF